MTTLAYWLGVATGIGLMLAVFFVWALCIAAGDADRASEDYVRSRR